MASAHVLGMSESVESRSAGFALRSGLVMLVASVADLAGINAGLGRVQDRHGNHDTTKVI